MRRALVTGATGLLGSHLVERLVSDGWAVRALVRQPVDAGWLGSLGVQLAEGDVRDPMSTLAAAAGCQAVFHAAAAIGVGGQWEAFEAPNVTGTRHIMEATEAAGARLVHVSSTAVFGSHRYRSTPTDEDVPLPRLPADDLYGRSKQDAERAVLAAHAAGRIWAAAVRPPVMYGRRDRQFVPRLAPLLERGVFPLVEDGATVLSLVHADSVADGAVRAVDTASAGGGVFHLTNDYDVTLIDLVRFAGEGLGRRIRNARNSARACNRGARTASLALRCAGRSDLARLALGALDMLTRDNPFTSERARRELGWAPRVPPSVGIPEAFGWWARQPASDHERR